MELNAPIGRAQLSPDIEYKAGDAHYKFGAKSYDRLKKKFLRSHYKNMTREGKGINFDSELIF